MTDDKKDKVPLFRTWKQWYFFLVLVLLILIILFSLLTQYFA